MKRTHDGELHRQTKLQRARETRQPHSESEITTTSGSAARALPLPTGTRVFVFLELDAARRARVLRVSDLSDATLDEHEGPGGMEPVFWALLEPCACEPEAIEGVDGRGDGRVDGVEGRVREGPAFMAPASPPSGVLLSLLSLSPPTRVLRMCALSSAMVSFSGIRSGSVDHEPRRALARTLASLKEWRRRDTVSPPREKARSTSVEVAVE